MQSDDSTRLQILQICITVVIFFKCSNIHCHPFFLLCFWAQVSAEELQVSWLATALFYSFISLKHITTVPQQLSAPR